MNSFGSSVTAAFTAASKVETLTQQLMSTLSTTTATFVGQNLGAGKMERIREGVRRCRQITDISSLILMVVVFLFWRNFVSLFISGDQPEVFEAAQTYLYIIMAFYLPLGWVNIFRNALQGMGESLCAADGRRDGACHARGRGHHRRTVRLLGRVPCKPDGLDRRGYPADLHLPPPHPFDVPI